MCIAISVLLGPGIRLLAPNKSRKCCSLIHFLFTTTSFCIIAICAAGPPKPIKPSFKKSFAISAIGIIGQNCINNNHLLVYTCSHCLQVIQPNFSFAFQKESRRHPEPDKQLFYFSIQMSFR